MKLYCVGSSSKGNCYLLQSEKTGQMLAIEAGIKLSRVKRAIGYDIRNIAGCIVSHEHGDHAKAVGEFAKACIPCYMSGGTREALKEENNAFVHKLQAQRIARIGEYEVIPFDVQHDAREPFGYLIRHEECGTVLFATDTYYLKYKFPKLTNILIECNYALDILERNIAEGLVTPLIRDRIVKAHMSYDTCMETLKANDLSRVNNILLIHLSPNNSQEERFVEGIARATGLNVKAATEGLTMAFNKTPY